MRPLIVAMLVLFSFAARAGEGLVSAAEGDRLLRAHWGAQKTGICSVHHIAMERKRVPIAWGLFDYDPVYSSAEIRHFPNAQEYIMGGCEADEKRAGERVSIYVCPACQRAKADWLVDHRKPEGDSCIAVKPPNHPVERTAGHCEVHIDFMKQLQMFVALASANSGSTPSC